MDSIRCSDCDQTFCSKYNLLRHRRNKHSKVEIKSRSGELTDHLGAPGAPQEAHLGAPGVPQGAHLGAPGAHLGAPGAHLGAPQGAPQGDILLPPPQGDLRRYMLSKYRIRKWLQREEAYGLQREARKPLKRSRIVVAGIDDQWSADLMDMVKFTKSNQGVRYILVVIDVFSKYLWLRPLKDKKGSSVVEAFESIFQEGRTPERIRTDKGQEFRARVVQSLFKSENIRHMFAESDVKASISERVIKTVKSKIYRYFTHTQSYEYVNELQHFAEGYNKTVHRTIDMKPIDVRRDNEEEARVATYLSRKKPERSINKLRFKFKVGDYVRISHTRNIFTRAYDESWTGEIFKVAQRFVRDGVPLYRLTDYNETEEIKGSFYTSELSKTEPPETFKVEQILKTRGKGKNKQYYVKFLHYPKQFNQWILASDVENV